MFKKGQQIAPLLESPKGKDSASGDDATKPAEEKREAGAIETSEEKSEPADTGSAGGTVPDEGKQEVKSVVHVSVCIMREWVNRRRGNLISFLLLVHPTF